MKLSRLLGGVIPVLAPLVILILIAKYGVNVPYADEWAIPGQFLVLENHTFADYFAQSNESRALVPKAIFLAVSQLVGWQPKHFMYLGWLLVLVIFILIHKVCYRRVTRGREQDPTGLLCLSLSSALLFSPAAFENWLWGIQWIIFIPLLCILAGFHIQDRTQSFALRFCATVVLNAVAMFSFANGMLLWVISFPFWREALRWLAGRRSLKGGKSRFWIWSALYVLTAAIFVRVYFIGYQPMPSHPSLAQALHDPVGVLKYLAAWCGGPFHAGAILRIILGIAFMIAVAVVFLSTALRVWKHPGVKTVSYLGMLYPSLLIIAYAFTSGLTTALGRAGFGVEQAFSSRYLFHSGALLVGLLAAFNSHRVAMLGSPQPQGNYGRTLRWTVVVFLLLFLRTWNHNFRWFEWIRLGRVQTQLTVRMLAVVPKSPLVEKACAWTDLSVLVKALHDRKLHETTSFGDWILDRSRHPETASGGFVRVDRPRPSEIRIAGWAVKPLLDAAADSVLVCRKGQSGELEPWLMLAIGLRNKEVPGIQGKTLPAKSGFSESFRWETTGDAPSLVMFAVDERDRRFYPLSPIP